MAKRVLVIGLDGLSPDLVQAWLPDLPVLAGLVKAGIYGPLESTVQPVTPVAWTSALSGRNPGHFGFTDFLHRVGNSYTDFRLVHSGLVRTPTLYTLLPAAGQRAVMIGVPVTYPPVRIPGGACVSCFMAPSLSRGITHPPDLQAEVLAHTSAPYLLDVSLEGGPELADRDALRASIREFDRQRFDIARYVMATRAWNLLFLVCMGTDRVGHAFMRFQDPRHARHDPDPRHRDAIREHYRYCDRRVGELIDAAGPETVVLVVSDHGLQRLDGKVSLNDWLAARGYLALSTRPSTPTPLAAAPVVWERTRAWARGYGGQIYLNVRGREPLGCVDPDDADALLDELAQRLRQEVTVDGERLRVDVVRRRGLYSGPYAERCPDLFIQIEGMRYLTADTVGHASEVRPVSTLGPDDAAHAPYGFFAMAGPGIPPLGRFAALHLMDVGPTVLDVLEVPAPSDLDGRAIHRLDDAYSSEDEAALTSRLRALYLA